MKIALLRWIQMKMLPITFCLSLLATVLGLAGCGNIYTSMSNQRSDSAIYYQAQMDINALDYGDAVTLIQSLSADFFSHREVQDTYASAYAGLCGLDLIKNALSISGASGNLLAVLLKVYDGGTTAKSADCVDSENVMLGISNAATGRTNDENVFMTFVNFADMGTIMSYVADTNNDGVPDPGFSQCSTSPFTDTLAAQVGVDLMLAIENLAAVGSSISGSSLAGLTSMCNAGGELNGYCNLTTVSAWTSTEIKYLRGVISSNQGIGLGTCTGTPTACGC